MARWQWRKSKSLLGGLVRVGLSRRGAGISVGVPSLRWSWGADGKRRRTISVPGTGLRKTETLRHRRRS